MENGNGLNNILVQYRGVVRNNRRNLKERIENVLRENGRVYQMWGECEVYCGIRDS